MSEQDATLDEFAEGEKRETQREVGPPTEIASLPEGWGAVRLGDVAKDKEGAFVDGPFGSNLKADEMVEEGYARIIQLQNIRESEFVDTNHKYISHEKFKELERHGAQPGDLAIAKMSEPVARACLLPKIEDQYLVVADCIKLSVDESKYNSLFVMLALNSEPVWKQAFARSRGSTRKRINLTQLKEVQIPSPSLDEQRKIASVLSTIDQAIQKTETIESQLQDTKKGLVQDFLTEGPGNSKVSETGTKLGPLPNHWDAVSIENIIADEENAFTDGARYSLSSDEIHSQGEARAILLEEVGEGEFDDSNPKFATQEKYEEITHRAIYPGEVVVAKMAEPVARACIVPETYDKYLLGCADVVRIVPDSRIEDRFLMYCMNSHKVWRQAVAHLRGTGRSRINLENIAELKIPRPPIEEQTQIVEVLSEFDNKIKTERQYRERLQRLKRGLMQDLLSGEIRTHNKDIEVVDDVLQYG